jgi:hypothetical protein
MGFAQIVSHTQDQAGRTNYGRSTLLAYIPIVLAGDASTGLGSGRQSQRREQANRPSSVVRANRMKLQQGADGRTDFMDNQESQHGKKPQSIQLWHCTLVQPPCCPSIAGHCQTLSRCSLRAVTGLRPFHYEPDFSVPWTMASAYTAGYQYFALSLSIHNSAYFSNPSSEK